MGRSTPSPFFFLSGGEVAPSRTHFVLDMANFEREGEEGEEEVATRERWGTALTIKG